MGKQFRCSIGQSFYFYKHKNIIFYSNYIYFTLTLSKISGYNFVPVIFKKSTSPVLSVITGYFSSILQEL